MQICNEMKPFRAPPRNMSTRKSSHASRNISAGPHLKFAVPPAIAGCWYQAGAVRSLPSAITPARPRRRHDDQRNDVGMQAWGAVLKPHLRAPDQPKQRSTWFMAMQRATLRSSPKLRAPCCCWKWSPAVSQTNGDQPSGEAASRTEAARLTAALVDQAGTTVRPCKQEILDIDDTFCAAHGGNVPRRATVAVAFVAARLATE
jgi:hypothetical protein